MRALALSALGIFAITSPIGLAVADEGVWYPEEQFAQVNVACFRAYLCRPGMDILHGPDTKLEVSDPERVWGVCSAGDGPIDSCNHCLTNMPAKKCEWKLVPK
jgi:hypothetical protein